MKTTRSILTFIFIASTVQSLAAEVGAVTASTPADGSSSTSPIDVVISDPERVLAFPHQSPEDLLLNFRPADNRPPPDLQQEEVAEKPAFAFPSESEISGRPVSQEQGNPPLPNHLRNLPLLNEGNLPIVLAFQEPFTDHDFSLSRRFGGQRTSPQLNSPFGNPRFQNARFPGRLLSNPQPSVGQRAFGSPFPRRFSSAKQQFQNPSLWRRLMTGENVRQTNGFPASQQLFNPSAFRKVGNAPGPARTNVPVTSQSLAAPPVWSRTNAVENIPQENVFDTSQQKDPSLFPTLADQNALPRDASHAQTDSFEESPVFNGFDNVQNRQQTNGFGASQSSQSFFSGGTLNEDQNFPGPNFPSAQLLGGANSNNGFPSFVTQNYQPLFAYFHANRFVPWLLFQNFPGILDGGHPPRIPYLFNPGQWLIYVATRPFPNEQFFYSTQGLNGFFSNDWQLRNLPNRNPFFPNRFRNQLQTGGLPMNQESLFPGQGPLFPNNNGMPVPFSDSSFQFPVNSGAQTFPMNTDALPVLQDAPAIPQTFENQNFGNAWVNSPPDGLDFSSAGQTVEGFPTKRNSLFKSLEEQEVAQASNGGRLDNDPSHFVSNLDASPVPQPPGGRANSQPFPFTDRPTVEPDRHQRRKRGYHSFGEVDEHFRNHRESYQRSSFHDGWESRSSRFSATDADDSGRYSAHRSRSRTEVRKSWQSHDRDSPSTAPRSNRTGGPRLAPTHRYRFIDQAYPGYFSHQPLKNTGMRVFFHYHPHNRRRRPDAYIPFRLYPSNDRHDPAHFPERYLNLPRFI